MLWQAARPIEAGDLADRYLRSRGLAGPWPATLHLGRYMGHPALIAAALRWPGDALAAVQATPLAEPGRKAWGKPARHTRGNLRGAAVRLAGWAPGCPLVIVEGVEDGLAVVQAAPDMAVWTVLGAANAADVTVPTGAEVILALDGDETGRDAASAAAAALSRLGHRVRVAELPDGRDPLDMLRESGR